MKSEPTFDKLELKQKILDVYNLVVKSFKFVPEGEFASSYIITTKKNEKYFLKLYFPSRLKNQQKNKFDFSLDIVHKLHNIQGLKYISYPIETISGNLKSQFQEAEMVLWNFIDGKIVSERKSKTTSFLKKVAELLAQIHDSSENLKFQDKLLYEFDITFKDDLLLCLREIAACTTSEDRTFLRLKKLITPLMNDILQSLTYLEEITQNLKAESPNNYVVCHNDPIRHNILLNKQDEIYLVDWDSAYLAPFEKDIWFYLVKKNYLSFKQKYKETRESTKLNEEIVAYLFYERVLADLTDWVYRILFEELDPIQVKNDFEGLEEDVIPFLPNMKRTEKDLRQRAKEW